MTSRFSSTLVIGVLGAMGVAAWSGCGPGEGRSYCDGSGCFTCDAYGCSRVAEPNHRACTGNNAGPCPCATATDCSGGLTCVAGACTAVQNTCTFSSECSDGKLCADGQCLASCTSTPCATGFTCTKGVCEPSSTTAPNCAADAPCSDPTAPNCVSGACVKSCSADPDCGAGNYCNQGACVVDTRPTPNCTDDAQCGGTADTPKKCLGGFCKFTCTSDAYCRTIDNRIGYCAKDGVCRSAAEANASCIAPSDCGAGQSCVDNTCR